MERRIDFSRWLMAFDLALVSVWGVCACWCIGHYSVAYLMVVPLIVLRLAMTFTLYRRDRNVLWLVGVGILAIGLLFAAFGGKALRVLLAPMAMFVETTWRVFSPDHLREDIDGGGVWANVAIWALSAFVYLTPIVWAGVLLCTKRFLKVKWNCNFRFHQEVIESSAILLVVAALIVGVDTPKWGSLIAMLLCSAMMIYLLCRKWDGAKWKKSGWLFAFILPANVCFWSSQFVIDFWRYALVFLSFGLVIAGSAFYYANKRKPIKSLALAICLGILIPFFSLGYNVLACTDAKRISDNELYPYLSRGLLLVEGKDGPGIRDRYGMVVCPSCERVGGEISSDSFRHALADEFYLDYFPENVNNPELLDQFLARMLRAVWEKDENTSYADHYWQWTQKTTADIDSLYENVGMFHCDSLDRYNAAMQQIDDYISDAVTQRSMNNHSYVYAVGRSYLMHRRNIELADALSEVNLQQEYRLFNEYQSYAEVFWEDVHDAIYGHYSDRPREVNMEAADRFDARADQVNEFLDVIQSGKYIQARGVRPSVNKIKTAFHEKMPGVMRPVGIECEYPTDTIGMYFLRWIEFRDQIANEMPAQLASSYRNQTTNIILSQMR